MGLENTIQKFAIEAMDGVINKIPQKMDKLGGGIKLPPLKASLLTSPPLCKNPKIDSLLKRVSNKIPSPDIIKSRICVAPTAEGATLNYNSLKSTLDKIKKILEKLNKQITKLESLIEKVRMVLETISTFLDILSVAIGVAKLLIVGFDSALTAQTVPHINGYMVYTLGDKKDKFKEKIKKYEMVIKGINILLKIIIPLLEGLENALGNIKSAVGGVDSLIESSDNMMDSCLEENLKRQILPTETEGVGLEELINIYNNNSSGLIKIREFESEIGSKKTVNYTVRNIPSEDLEN